MAEGVFRTIAYDTDASYEADTVTEEPSEGHTLAENSEGLGLAEMSANTLTSNSSCSCNHSSPLHELSGCTSAGTHSPPSVFIDFSAGSSESAGSPDVELAGSLAMRQMLSYHKPEAVLLPPRLAALALKRGDRR